MSDATTTWTPDVASDIRGAHSHLIKRLLTNPTGAAALVVLAIIVFCAVFASVLTPVDPNAVDIHAILSPPSPANPLGTDSAGRDVLSRLLLACRFSLLAAVWAVFVAAVIGVTTGLIAGYYQKWFESVSLWITSILQALPGIVVLLAARAVLGPSIWLIMAVFGVILSPSFYRLTHAAVVGVRNELFIDAARVAGVGDISIVGRHILSVVRAPIIIQASILLGIAISIQSGLDFLGLGDSTIPTWGQMLNDGFSKMYQTPLLLLWPGLAIAVTSIALVLLGNALRDELERAAGAKKRRMRRRQGEAQLPPVGVASSEPTIVHEDRSADEDPLLEVRGLGVGYGQPDDSVKQVVQDVSLSLRRGEVHGLLGESGSGKTQTAWSILRLLPEGGRILSGSVVFDGKDLAGLSETEMRKMRGRRIAYIPQEPMSNLDPSFTIGSQLVEPMVKTLGINGAEAKQRALALLKRVGIPNPNRAFASYPHQVSGGMAQRVLIAGAVSCEADLIIADEPTTALDVTIQAEILDLLRGLQRDLQVSVLMVTHNFGVVADLCDRVSIMQNGRILETGPTQQIFDDPQHPYTRSLFDAILDDAAPRGALTEVPTVTPKEPANG